MMTVKSETTPTIKTEIFIAGDYSQAKQICRQWCMDVGACVTVEKTDYIYTGGQESGVRIGFINYPRFPSNADEIFNRASELAAKLMEGLCQNSYTIVAPEFSIWVSRKKCDE